MYNNYIQYVETGLDLPDFLTEWFTTCTLPLGKPGGKSVRGNKIISYTFCLKAKSFSKVEL